MGSFRRLAESESDDSLTELRKADSHSSGPLWYQTELRHPGQRVRLETVELAFAREPEIYACVTTQLQRLERCERLLLNLLSRFTRQLRREFFGRHPRRVLALVIVNLVLRQYLPNGKRHLTENTNRELTAWNEPLDHDFIVVLGGFLNRRGEILTLLHQRQSNSGPLLRRLYYNWQAE